MRHLVSGRKFSRTTAHREAMFSNMVSSLFIYERIETTEPKAKELKRLADRTISWGTSVGDLLVKGRDKLDADERARVVHAMRMAQRMVRQKEALAKLFSDLALRFRGRSGGFTRLLKTRIRPGDAAPMAWVELTERGQGEPAASEPAETSKGAKAKAGGAATKAEPAKTTKAKGAAPKAAAPKQSAKAKGEKAEGATKAEKAPAEKKSKKTEK